MPEDEREMLRVRCACGWETSGPEDAAVRSTQEHGRRAHNMLATREQILEMAVDSEEGPASTAVDLGRPAAGIDP
jgi:predicted small metal-binding protein